MGILKNSYSNALINAVENNAKQCGLSVEQMLSVYKSQGRAGRRAAAKYLALKQRERNL
jgi:hypothetical protein